MNAPEPIFTSSTMECAPAASFLDMMDDVMSGRESTRRRHIAQRVELLVCRRQVAGLADDGNADLLDLLQELLCRRASFCSRGWIRAYRPCRPCGRARGRTFLPSCRRALETIGATNQRRLIAHAAGGVLVYRLCCRSATDRSVSPERIIASVRTAVSWSVMPL